MELVQTLAQGYSSPVLVPKLEPQLLLTLLVAFMFLILVVIGALSRNRRGRQRREQSEDPQWREVLLRRFAELDEKSSQSEDKPPGARIYP